MSGKRLSGKVDGVQVPVSLCICFVFVKKSHNSVSVSHYFASL